ncbi:hypothetical protein NMY22_g7509 [Coprinellus aureogranulatus]|nr:hypothetical protein NMY22_g7509 [Coprinellus aureogranulatus]
MSSNEYEPITIPMVNPVHELAGDSQAPTSDTQASSSSFEEMSTARRRTDRESKERELSQSSNSSVHLSPTSPPHSSLSFPPEGSLHNPNDPLAPSPYDPDPLEAQLYFYGLQPARRPPLRAHKRSQAHLPHLQRQMGAPLRPGMRPRKMRTNGAMPEGHPFRETPDVQWDVQREVVKLLEANSVLYIFVQTTAFTWLIDPNGTDKYSWVNPILPSSDDGLGIRITTPPTVFIGVQWYSLSSAKAHELSMRIKEDILAKHGMYDVEVAWAETGSKRWDDDDMDQHG